MKNIYFYGCSFTAGDELSDEIWFPWKFTEQHTLQSYYEKRNETLGTGANCLHYMADNKKKAFPAQIELPDLTIFNQAENGKSLRQNIFEIVRLLVTKNDVTAIYLQLPPTGREMFMYSNGDMTSLQYAIVDESLPWNRYNTTKQVTHDYRQNSLEDFIDLLMLAAYIKSKNVYFKILILGPELIFRNNDVAEFKRFDDVVGSVNSLPMLDLIDSIPHSERLLGDHMSLNAHKIVAKHVEADLCQNVLSK